MDNVPASVRPVQDDVLIHIGRAVNLAEPKLIPLTLAALPLDRFGQKSGHNCKISFALGFVLRAPFLNCIGLTLEGQGHARHFR